MSPRAGEGAQEYAKGSAPHIRASTSVARHYWFRVLALLPALLFSVFSYGELALGTGLAVCLAAAAVELAKRYVFKKKHGFLRGHAVVTVLLFMLLLPPGISFSMAFLGAFFILVFGVDNYGGLGAYLFHPAVLGFALLWAVFPGIMTDGLSPDPPRMMSWGVPLKAAVLQAMPANTSYYIGHSAGPLGEGSPAALILGGIFLIRQKLIRADVPLIYLGLLNGLVLITPGLSGPAGMSGMACLSAFFLLTDPTVSPTTRRGQRLFAAGAAFAAHALFAVTHQPLAIPLSVLMMNAFTPWIDEWVRPAASYFVSKTSKAHMAEATRS